MLNFILRKLQNVQVCRLCSLKAHAAAERDRGKRVRQKAPFLLKCVQTHAAALKSTYPGVAQLVARLLWEQDWATAVYNGQWYSPLKNALDAFMADTQKFVTGTVRLKFFKGNCHVVGRKSPFSLYDYGLATYDRDTTFDEKASAGFIEIDTLSLKTWAKVQGPSSAAAQA